MQRHFMFELQEWRDKIHAKFNQLKKLRKLESSDEVARVELKRERSKEKKATLRKSNTVGPAEIPKFITDLSKDFAEDGQSEQDIYDDFVKSMKLNRSDLKKLEELKKYEEMEWFKEVVKLNAGQSFGELALLNDAKRAATVKALRPSFFAVIDREGYNKVLKRIESKQLTAKVDFLSQMPFLAHWTKSQISKLTYSFYEKAYCRN